MDHITQSAWPSSDFSVIVSGASPMGGAEALPNNPFLSQWQACSTHRLIRDVGGEVLDAHVPAPKIASAAIDKLVTLTKPLVADAKDYKDLFNWQDFKVGIGPKHNYASTLHVLLSPEGRMDLKDTAYLNLGKTGFKPMSPWQIFKNIVVGDNVRTIVDPLSKNGFYTGSFRLGWLGLGALPVLERTKRHYQQTQSFSAAIKVFAKESFKALGAWEFATIGTLLGGALLPVGWVAGVARAVMMGLFSATAHQKLDKWVP